MMTAHTLRIFGAALILIGGAKAWMHSQAAGLLKLPTCLGPDVLVRIDTPLWHQVHCWGCYAVLAGVAFLALPIIQRRLERAR